MQGLKSGAEVKGVVGGFEVEVHRRLRAASALSSVLKPDCVEGSIQTLLSDLYPPFESTAPTLLSQLFALIQGRYHGDALRCLLHFLVPARHILDSVQQAACSQYPEKLFLHEGWPLCLRDRVVIHLSPPDPRLLCPGDFYLQVAPFCDQSARILVCSLLEEAGLRQEDVHIEETPVPETSYPCIFTADWLKDLNQDRNGTPLSHCLLANEQGVVRLPWERVAIPEFVDISQNRNIMASVPSSFPPLPPPLPSFPESSSSLSITKPVLQAQTSTNFSVETRIRPAKHGIAVSLRLVDTSVASSLAKQANVSKESEQEAKPVGWVSPSTWDTREKDAKTEFKNCASTEPYTISDNKESIEKRNIAEGEYIDIMQATMLFGKAQLANEQEEKIQYSQMQKLLQTEMQHQPMDSYMQTQGQLTTFMTAKLPPRPHDRSPPLLNSTLASPTMSSFSMTQAKSTLASSTTFTNSTTLDHSTLAYSSQANSSLANSTLANSSPANSSLANSSLANSSVVNLPLHNQTVLANSATQANATTFANTAVSGNSNHHSHQLESPESSPCLRGVQFSENPCTPCMQRKSIGKLSKAQDLRCKYRDSYQAAIQNPVSSVKDQAKFAMCAVLEEESDPQHNSYNPLQTDARSQRGNFHAERMQVQSNAICKESGEKNAITYWKAEDGAPCVEYSGTDTSKQEAMSDRTTVPLRDQRTTINGLPPRIPNAAGCSSSMQGYGFHGYSHGNHGMIYVEPNRDHFVRANSGFYSPQSRRGSVQSDGRCSSLSTAVVDTSERCDVVIVDGQRVRRKESQESSADVPQLHVVKCKNSTAFGLVSPKISRRKLTIPDSALSGPSISFHPEVQSKPAPALVQRSPPSLTALPRPDYLPLGSTDTRGLLLLGVTALTGGRDKSGRVIVEVYGEHPGWRGAVTSQELYKVLLYFYSITRREIREAGLTVIFDARKSSPQPQLYKALMSLEELCPRSVHSLVLLIDKENKQRPERCPGIQTEILTSMKSLLKLVEGSQLSPHLDGTLPSGRCDWNHLHQKLFPFVCDLHDALELLLRAISKLQEPKRTDSVQSVQQCMADQRTLMRDVLEDSRLVSLQREGGAMLARLRKESELRYPHCDELSDAVDSVGSLYARLEEQVHVLVQRSNMALEQLQYLLQLRDMQGHFTQMQQWFDEEGERHLLEVQSVVDSGEHLEQILNSFTGFLIEANDRRHHATSLVSEAERLQQSGTCHAETEVFRAFVDRFKCGLEEFLCRAEACGRELQTMVQVCDFCEQASALASECMDYLERSHSRTPTNLDQTLDQPPCPDPSCPSTSLSVTPPPPAPADLELSTLHGLLERLDHFSPERFQEVKVQAGTLRGSRGMRVWNAAWLRCQEARQQLEERVLERTAARDSACCEHHYIDVVSTDGPPLGPGGQALVVQSTPGPGHPQWDGIVSGAVGLGERRFIASSYGPAAGTAEEQCGERADIPPQSPRRSVKKSERESRRRQAARARSERDAAALSQAHTVGCQWFPWSRSMGLGRSVSQDSCGTGLSAGGAASSSSSPSCRILQEAQRYQLSRHGSFCSEESCPSERGAAGGMKSSSLPISTYEQGLCPPEGASNSHRLQRVLEELLYTEREYVRSLGYILTHYLPLLDRPDVPQDLRGKRAVIFGNLEKLYDFHCHRFLPELEAAQGGPALVARCFLRHSESFGLYALYSKNKPKSDILILHRRHDIFKRKQQELGDHMDLSSYLLRPIQRISKYSLLLQDMLALVTPSLCGPGVYMPEYIRAERDRERADIQAAADLVRFQMRHGNDLLTMDAIRDCDVNLKEQGQLVRQDEFTVIFRKKKCVRRVFLFEELILFSKTKKTDVGNDVYVYKQSFKTSDVGMTHNSSLSGLCFEIWFRRRKSEDTYTLRAASVEVKKAWTMDLERLLWNQANHSREMRLQERVFMGIGHKPFLDIQPSDAAICDRAVNCSLPGRIPVACCSHRGLVPRPNSIGSGSTASTTISQSSSSSGRGSLPPAGYHGNACPGAEMGPGGLCCSTPEAAAENELNNLHLHQHHLQHCGSWRPPPLLDSTDSSGDCAPVFSSDQSCLSALGGEVVDSPSSLLSLSRRGSLCRTPSLRTGSSPALSRRGLPGVHSSSPALSRRGPAGVHKSQSLPTVQVEKSSVGKSTEV